MLRALSTGRNHRGYKELSDDHEELYKPSSSSSSNHNGLQAKLSRVASVPAKIFSPSRKQMTSFTQLKSNNNQSNLAAKEAKKASKIHPLFALFDTRRSKKATSNPEFLRYVQYLKEGGHLGQQLK